jgi:hypothetical protein
VALLPLGRRVRLAIEFARASEPLAFYVTVALYFAVGVALVACGTWWLRRLASSSYRPQAISEIAEVITGLERQAPSELNPLWIGLLVLGAVILIIYAVA